MKGFLAILFVLAVVVFGGMYAIGMFTVESTDTGIQMEIDTEKGKAAATAAGAELKETAQKVGETAQEVGQAASEAAQNAGEAIHDGAQKLGQAIDPVTNEEDLPESIEDLKADDLPKPAEPEVP